MRTRKHLLQGCLWLIITMFSSTVCAKIRVTLLNVLHDGYCFYHAVHALHPLGDNGQSLHSILRDRLQTPDNPDTLNDQLQHVLIGSGLNTLNEHLNQTPQLNNPATWASFETAVAMSYILQMPILVIVLTADGTIAPESFLATGQNVLPLSTIDAHTPHSIPAIQLMISGNNWFAIQHEIDEHSPPLLLHQYIDELTQQHNHLINNFQAGTSQHLQLTEEYISTTLNFACFNHRFSWVLGHYAARREQIQRLAEEVQAHSQKVGKRFIVSSDYNYEPGALQQAHQLFLNAFHFLMHPLALGIIGQLLNDYLEYTQQTLFQFMSNLNPEHHQVWQIISEINPELSHLAIHLPGNLQTGGIIGTLLKSSQSREVSPLKDIQLQRPRPIMPSGIQQPNTITMEAGSITIPFDQDSPVHHALNALFVTARQINIANACILTLITGITTGNYRSIFNCRKYLSLNIIKRPNKTELLKMLQLKLDTVLDEIHALVHALGRHYFNPYWQLDHYICLIIEDGDYIVFHSDDFAPRGGWKDLDPPPPKKGK